MSFASGPVALVGRILLAFVFVSAGYNKIWNIAATAAYMASHGIPLSGVLVYGAIVVEIVGGLMVMAGLYARWAAGITGLYTVALAFIFHAYWAMPAAAMRMQHAIFFEHLSIVGGMFMVVALGAGPLSLDAWRRRNAVEGGVGVGGA